MSDTYEMGQVSAVPDVSRMQFDDAVDAIMTWFFANFEDPAEITPWVDGEYAYVHGGPCDAREEIGSAFASTDEKIIDAAAERIEYDGYEWAPSQSRMIAEAGVGSGCDSAGIAVATGGRNGSAAHAPNHLQLVALKNLSLPERHIASIRTRMVRRDRYRMLLGELHELAERHHSAVAYSTVFENDVNDDLVDETVLGDLFVAMNPSAQDIKGMRRWHQHDSQRRRNIDRTIDEWLKQVTPQRLW